MGSSIPLPPPPHHHPAPLTATVGTLPTRTPVRVYTLPTFGPDAPRWLLEVDEDTDPDRLTDLYRHLRHPVRPYIWDGLGTPDPDLDPAGYQRAKWWDDLTHIDRPLIHKMAKAGLIHPWVSAQ